MPYFFNKRPFLEGGGGYGNYYNSDITPAVIEVLVPCLTTHCSLPSSGSSWLYAGAELTHGHRRLNRGGKQALGKDSLSGDHG